MRFPERELCIERHYSAFASMRAKLGSCQIFSGKLCTTPLYDCHQTLSLPRDSLASETKTAKGLETRGEFFLDPFGICWHA